METAKRNVPILAVSYVINFFCTWLVIQGLFYQRAPHVASTSTQDGVENESQKKIVIIAQGRSGSSFVSSWFGADPDVLYFIEPCSATYLKAYRGTDFTGRNCSRVVGELLSCNFSSVDVSRDQRPFIPELAAGFKGWGHQSKKSLKGCKKQKAIAVKEIRTGMAWARFYRGRQHQHESDGFVDVPSGFSPDLSRPRATVKYLILVRDPRAVFASRKDWPQPSVSGTKEDEATEPRGYSPEAHRGFPYMQSVRSMCVEHLALRRRATQAAAEGDSGVMLVEYARVLNEPFAILEEVFQFVGMAPVPPHVRAFVEKNVKGDCQHVDSPFSVCRKTQLRGEGAGELQLDEKWKRELGDGKLGELLKFPECKEIVDRFYASGGDSSPPSIHEEAL